MILILSFISSFEMTEVIYFPALSTHSLCILWIALSIGEALAIVTNDDKIFLAKQRPTFINWSAKKQEILLI